jgi:hypothetical protein
MKTINEIIELLAKNEIIVKDVTELSNETITEYLVTDSEHFIKIYHDGYGDWLDFTNIEQLDDDSFMANTILPEDAYKYDEEIILTGENILLLKKVDFESLK